MDVKEKEIETQAKTIVDEIGHKMSIYAVKTLALILRGPIRRIYKGIHINKSGFEQVTFMSNEHFNFTLSDVMR